MPSRLRMKCPNTLRETMTIDLLKKEIIKSFQLQSLYSKVRALAKKNKKMNAQILLELTRWDRSHKPCAKVYQLSLLISRFP